MLPIVHAAVATIPVIDGAGWSDDGMQSVVRVDPHQVQDWVAGLLHDQAQGKTEELAYTPAKTTASVVNDTDINGLASSVSEVLSAKGFSTGTVGNNDGGHVKASQVRAAKADDLGAQQVAKELGGLPVVPDPALAAGSVKVVLANDYTGPGSGLGGGSTGQVVNARASNAGAGADTNAPPPSPILTAGSDKPECIN